MTVHKLRARLGTFLLTDSAVHNQVHTIEDIVETHGVIHSIAFKTTLLANFSLLGYFFVNIP